VNILSELLNYIRDRPRFLCTTIRPRPIINIRLIADPGTQDTRNYRVSRGFPGSRNPQNVGYSLNDLKHHVTLYVEDGGHDRM